MSKDFIPSTSRNPLQGIVFNEDGLIPVIAQDAHSHRVLMLAWMNEMALIETLRSGYAVYWSRSRQKLWRKGEESGNQQKLVEMMLDCDGDALLMRVSTTQGVSCHTGRESCFYFSWQSAESNNVQAPLGGSWRVREGISDAVKIDPQLLYGTP